MIKKRILGLFKPKSPTKVIERAPKLVESAWVKYPTKKLKNISSQKYPHEVYLKKKLINQNKKHSVIHTHNDPSSVLELIQRINSKSIPKIMGVIKMAPSKSDVVNKSHSKNLSSNIIAVRKFGKVEGYIFMKQKNIFVFPKKQYKKFINSDEKNLQKNFVDYIGALEKVGLRIRFVPNKKRGYYFDAKEISFKKKN